MPRNRPPAAKAEVLPPRNAALPAVDPAEIRRVACWRRCLIWGRAEGAGADWGQTDGKAKFSGYSAAWDYLPTSRTQVWSQSEFAVAHLPPRYSARGRSRRIVRCVCGASFGEVTPAAGSHQLLLRAIRGSRVWGWQAAAFLEHQFQVTRLGAGVGRGTGPRSA